MVCRMAREVSDSEGDEQNDDGYEDEDAEEAFKVDEEATLRKGHLAAGPEGGVAARSRVQELPEDYAVPLTTAEKMEQLLIKNGARHETHLWSQDKTHVCCHASVCWRFAPHCCLRCSLWHLGRLYTYHVESSATVSCPL